MQIALDAAVEWCEAAATRSLRVSHTVVQTYSGWPMGVIRFDLQPVKSISSITYYDVAGSSQTVSSSNYRLHASSDGAGVLEWGDNYSLPSVDVRGDAVTITYLAGYDDLDSVPSMAKFCILLKLRELFGDLTDREAEYTRQAIKTLLSQIGWGPYR